MHCTIQHQVVAGKLQHAAIEFFHHTLLQAVDLKSKMEAGSTQSHRRFAPQHAPIGRHPHQGLYDSQSLLKLAQDLLTACTKPLLVKVGSRA